MIVDNGGEDSNGNNGGNDDHDPELPTWAKGNEKEEVEGGRGVWGSEG